MDKTSTDDLIVAAYYRPDLVQHIKGAGSCYHTYEMRYDPEAPPFTNECGYQWAYEDLPELTTYFDQATKNIVPNSTSHATAFGENCIGNDGQIVRFIPMETDFYMLAFVESLDDYETFGIWLAQVMQIVNAIPPDMIAGPKPGFVEFMFEQNTTENIRFRVPIQQYNEIANGIPGEELLRIFYSAQ